MFKRYPQWYRALMMLAFVAAMVVVARLHQSPAVGDRTVIGMAVVAVLALAIMLWLGPRTSPEDAWENDFRLIMGVLNNELTGPRVHIAAWHDGSVDGLQKEHAAFVDPSRCRRLKGTLWIYVPPDALVSARPTATQQMLLYCDPMESAVRGSMLKAIIFGVSGSRMPAIATEAAAPLGAHRALLLDETDPLLSVPKPQPGPR